MMANMQGVGEYSSLLPFIIKLEEKNMDIVSKIVLAVTILYAAAMCGWFLYIDATYQGKSMATYFVDGLRAFAHHLSLVGRYLWRLCQRLAAAIAKCIEADQRARRPRWCFGDSLWYAFDAIIKDYQYIKLEHEMGQSENELPAYVFIHFYAQQAMTEDRAQELLWHLTAAFRQYLTACGLNFVVVPTYYISKAEVIIYLYYCEYADELPLLYTLRNQLAQSGTTPGFGTLKDPSLQGKGKVVLGYSEKAWEKAKAEIPFIWDFERVPHLLIAGPTGGGKSVCAQLIVRQLLQMGQNVSFCDFKAGGDWQGISAKYAEYNACDDLLNDFYSKFAAALEAGKPDGHHRFLVFDEFSSYALSKDAKDFKALMAKVGQLALMGRSYGYHLIFISQQFSAKVIDTGIREQFGVRLYMGATISTESAGMLFPGAEIDRGHHLPKYTGYIATPEKELDTILVPKVDPTALKAQLEQLGNDS